VDQAARADAPKISLSQGGKWNALINRYIGVIPPSDAQDADAQSPFIALPPEHAVIKARIAKVGVAARQSHSARPSAVLARPASASA
jgi:hypothetical protein